MLLEATSLFTAFNIRRIKPLGLLKWSSMSKCSEVLRSGITLLLLIRAVIVPLRTLRGPRKGAPHRAAVHPGLSEEVGHVYQRYPGWGLLRGLIRRGSLGSGGELDRHARQDKEVDR